MQYPVRYEESMNTVLLQECIRYNKLILEMQRSLPELQKALQGLVVMSAELEAMGDSIAVNQVMAHMLNEIVHCCEWEAGRHNMMDVSACRHAS